MPGSSTAERTAIAVVAGAFRLFVAFRPLETLLTWTIYDDAFYYFVTAGHFVADWVPSFDGRNPTNGFHPLWMAVNVLVVAIVGLNDVALRSLIVIEALLDTATAVLLYALARRVTGRNGIAFVVALLYAANPKVVLMQLNGMEGALAGLLVTTTLWALVETDFLRRDGSRGASIVGASAGFLILARTETIVFVGVALIVCLFGARSWRSRDSLRSILIAASVAGLIVLPWFTWMYCSYGTLVQTSGLIEPFWRKALILNAVAHSPHPTLALIWRAAKNFVAGLRLAATVPFVALRNQLPEWLAVVTAAFLAVGGVCAAWPTFVKPRQSIATTVDDRVRKVVALCTAWFVAFAGLHGIVRWGTLRFYYAATTTPLVYLLAAVIMAGITWIELSRARQRILVAASAMMLLFLLVATATFNFRTLRHQGTLLQAARWIDEHVPRDAVVGSFNSGIIGFYSHRVTINLDGAINHSAAQARLAGDLTPYVRAQRIDYIADSEPPTGGLLRAVWFPLTIDGELVKQFPGLMPRRSVYSIYRIAPPSH